MKLYINGIVQFTKIWLPLLHKNVPCLVKVTGAFHVAKNNWQKCKDPDDSIQQLTAT